MMALRATAESGDRFAIVIDKAARVKKMPPCEQWLNNEASAPSLLRRCAKANEYIRLTSQ
jgi:hypothetical protein